MCKGHQMSHILAPVCLSPGKSTAKLCLTSWGAALAPTLPSSVSSLCLLPNPIRPPQLGSSELPPDTMSWGEWATG